MKKEQAVVECWLVQGQGALVQWVRHVEPWHRALAYGWSDGSVTWKA